jgi:histidine triad (HIT) family protein
VAEKNIFQQIIDREIKAEIIHEDELCLAFRDIAPQAPAHVLVIPKKAIASLDDLAPDDQALVGHLVLTAARLAGQLDLAGGYRLVVNCGPDGGQSVDHLHLHLLGGRQMQWPPG